MKRIALIALVLVGCEPAYTMEEELRMNCDHVDDSYGVVWRCENAEAICYAYDAGISCMRKRAPLPPPVKA